jgi:1-acyl-sn-glycerol-3-phosphate acyltransferase
VKNFNKIPETGALLFAANHPNSFLDGIVLAMVQKRKLHFLTRADVFRNPFVARLLNAIGLIPIYRSRDKGTDVRKNKEVFEAVFNIFDKGGAVLIFSEGTSRLDRRVKDLKKGTARLVLSYLNRNDGDKPLHVIIAGINYFSYQRRNAPILVEFLIDQNINNPNYFRALTEVKAMQQFNHYLLQALNDVVIQASAQSDNAIQDIFNSLENLQADKIPSIKEINTSLLMNEDWHLSINKIKHKDMFTLLSFLYKIVISILCLPGFLFMTLLKVMATFINTIIPLPAKFHASVIFSVTFFLWLFSSVFIVALSLLSGFYWGLLFLLSLPLWNLSRNHGIFKSAQTVNIFNFLG